jgi:opine dehydrogenase
VLDADLANLNAILHPPGMVCNAGWIQATAGKFGFYAEGSGPAVAQVMDAIDAERLALARELGARAVPFTELFRQLGFTTGGQAHAGSVYHAIQRSELIRPIQSLPQLDHRYLHEDVGWGLVPWMHLPAAGSPAPTITALTHLAGVINGIDYPRQGLTLERMGLAGKTPAQIRAHVSAPAAGPADGPPPNPEVRSEGYARHAGSARSAPSAAS